MDCSASASELGNDVNLEALYCTIGLRAEGQSVSTAVSIPSVIHSARDGSTRNGYYFCRDRGRGRERE